MKIDNFPRGWMKFVRLCVAMVVGAVLTATFLEAQDCPQAFIKYKSGSTNRIRAGYEAFTNKLDSLGNLRLFLQYEKVADENLDGENCSEMQSMSKDIHMVDLKQWSMSYWPTQVIDGGECGIVKPSVARTDGTISYSHGPHSCSREMVNSQWTTTNECPNFGYDFTYGGALSGIDVETWSATEHYVGLTVTNVGGCIDRSGTKETTETLSNENTVDTLVTALKGEVNGQLASASWGGSRTASFSLSGAGTCGSYSAFKFQYTHRAGCGVEYEVVLKRTYSVSTRGTWPSNPLPGQTLPSLETTSYTVYETNKFTGDDRVHTSPEILVEPPTGGTIRASSVTVELISPGAAGCGSQCGFGTSILSFCPNSNSGGGSGGGMEGGGGYVFSLGNAGGESGGFLSIEGPSVGATSVTIAELKFALNGTSGEIIGNPPSQIKTPSGIVTLAESGGAVLMNFYSSVGSKDPMTGQYSVVSNSLVASYVITASSSGSGASTVSRLRITPGSGPYTEIISSNNWFFVDRGTGLWFERMNRITNSIGSSLTNAFQILDNSGNVLLAETVIYATNELTHEKLKWMQIRGVGSEALTNVWLHQLNGSTNDINYGKLIWTIDELGGWNRNVWDTNGVLIKNVVGFANVATNASESACRVFEYDYTPIHPNDGNGDDPTVPRLTREKVQGSLIAMRGLILHNGNRSDIVFHSDNFGGTVNPDAAGNLKMLSVELTRTNGTGLAQISPNGVLALSYQLTNVAGTYMTNVLVADASGVDYDWEDITNGTRTVTVTSVADGHIQFRRTYDCATGILFDEQVYSYFGSANDSYTITYLDGSTETHNRTDCCGLNSLIERSGGTNEYVYDSRKRLILAKRLGIITSNVIDNAGRIVEIWRIGTDGSSIRQVLNTYDTLGRETMVTDALGNTTTNFYSFASDGRFVMETRLPDGANRQQIRNRDGSSERLVGSAVHGKRYTNWAADGVLYSRWIALQPNETDTDETATIVLDFARRDVGTLYPTPTGASSTNIYHLDKLVETRDPDGVGILRTHDNVTRDVATTLDINRNSIIDTNSDRITLTTRRYASSDLGVGSALIEETLVWPENGNNTPSIVARNERSVDGLSTRRMAGGRTNQSSIIRQGGGLQLTISTNFDKSYTVITNIYGRDYSVTHRDSSGTQLGQTVYSYDAHGRRKFITDFRNGTTTNFFDSLDRVITYATPAPGNGDSSQRKGYRFDALGRLTMVTNADNTLLYNEYFDTGELKKTFGSRTYPVEYTYDYAGRMKTMKTWQNFDANGGTATTTWNYDSARGWLANKRYADNTGPEYAYTPAGRLYQRTWARGVITTYITNAAGEVASVDYSDSTPDITYTYDRLGRRTTISDGAGTHVLSYDLDGRLLLETNTAGILAGLAVTNGYDALNRRFALGLVSDANTLVNYGYDGASRLVGVTNGVNTASYSYVANSPLVNEIEFKQSGAPRMTTTKSYDYLNRLTLITNYLTGASSENPSFAYAHNTANQRIGITNADASRWSYTYDSLGQVTSGSKRWNDGSLVLGQQFEYTFDDIGNRKTAVSGGDANGRQKRVQNYTVNNLNQYTQRTVPGYVDIIGSATNAATVTVNHVATSRKGDYYRGEVPMANSAAAAYPSITNMAVMAAGTNDYVTNAVGNLFVPKTPEVFGYDLDGNMTNDGRWAMTWDAENRLIAMESLPNAPIGSSNRLTFAYDQQSRRVSKAVQVFTGGTWSIALSNRFVYDRWNLLTELNATNNAVINSFIWGLDLSGSMQGAGGVGGLLSLTATNAATYFAGYDGNGNVTLVVSATSGATSANYEYDPFGRTLRQEGSIARANPFRFSTKYLDIESDLAYYGYRFFSTAIGRWVSRDPSGERGGYNIYQFVSGDPVNRQDYLGLAEIVVVNGMDITYECSNGKISGLGFPLTGPETKLGDFTIPADTRVGVVANSDGTITVAVSKKIFHDGFACCNGDISTITFSANGTVLSSDYNNTCLSAAASLRRLKAAIGTLPLIAGVPQLFQNLSSTTGLCR